MAVLSPTVDRVCWPAEALRQLARPDLQLPRRAQLLLRAQLWLEAEAFLLSRVQVCSIPFDLRMELLAQLRLLQGATAAAAGLIQQHCPRPDPDRQGWWLCHQQLLQQQGRFQAVLDLGLPPDPHPLLRLQLAEAALWLNRLELAQPQLVALPEGFEAPELHELQARYCLLQGRHDTALQCLGPLLEGTPGSPIAWETAISVLQAKGDDLPAATLLNRALAAHPRAQRLHARQLLRLLLTRRPALARRHALLQRLQVTGFVAPSDLERSDANLCTSYEHGGRSDLLPFLHPRLQARSAAAPLALANQALQLASLAHPGYPAALQQLVAHLPLDTLRAQPWPQSAPGGLRLGLISPDFNYHPVGRFVAMLLAQGLGHGGELHLVASGGRQDSTTRLIEDLASQQGHFHDLQRLPEAQRLSRLRELQLDVAVDLAGWTGDNASVLFASRIAPLQVNYLGYFASTGIPALDVWLGDQALFPEPMQEWHSERIWRLPRCFLAWQPPANLPEGQLEVLTGPPPRAPITFGSFNHARKLSTGTLRLWGALLDAIPGSRLALKSYTTDDPGTVQLLRQRMRRCGLDPERVLWLPTTPTPTDHLRQYGLLDVALDPFPNGGCTTSCEALWMGVPVITLRGDRYGSRMSTAVLEGAGMAQWIAGSEAEYLTIARHAAYQLQVLRQGRAALRAQLQASALGDAAGLNRTLWQAFAAMPAALRAA